MSFFGPLTSVDSRGNIRIGVRNVRRILAGRIRRVATRGRRRFKGSPVLVCRNSV